jgi:hypothetical protein
MDWLAMLLPPVLAMYPGVLSKAGGVTFVFLQRLRLWASKSRGFENLVDNYNEARREEYALAERAYYLIASTYARLVRRPRYYRARVCCRACGHGQCAEERL